MIDHLPDKQTTAVQKDAELTTERLAHLVHQKTVLVRELHKLVTKQQDMIRNHEVDLIPLLAVKQRVIEALNEIDHAMDPFRQQDPETRYWKSAECRAACREQAEQCEALFRQVLLLENECNRALQEQHQKTRDQLQGAVVAGQASRAYQRTSHFANHHSTQIDLTSEG